MRVFLGWHEIAPPEGSQRGSECVVGRVGCECQGEPVSIHDSAKSAGHVDDIESSKDLWDGDVIAIVEFGMCSGQGEEGDIDGAFEHIEDAEFGGGTELVAGETCHERSPSVCRTRATTSRSTSLRFLRAARRNARVATRSMSRSPPAAASWSKATASGENSSLLPPTRPTRMRT